MKNTNKYILASSLIVVTSLFTACSQSASSVLNKDPIYAQNLQYTKVGKIINSGEVQAIVNVTYLNSVDAKKYNTNGTQNFIIGTYVVDDKYNSYSLKMNGQTPTSKKEISKEDKLYENIAYRNHWGKYHFVTFNDTKDDNITINYSNKNNTTTLTFIKE
jgi:hypothetical protein